MFKQIALSLAMLAGFAFARAVPSTAPTTSPSHFPTPAELAAKIKAAEAHRQKLPQVAYINLPDEIAEKPADFSFFASGQSGGIEDLLQRIDKARDDDHIKALLLTVGQTQMNLSQAEEIASALADCYKHGKRVFVYADSYDTADYVLATGASDICMLPAGDLILPGVGLEPMFAKGVLDKIGVQADYVEIGEYKGAAEQFTRSTPTPQLVQEFNLLADALYGQLIDTVSVRRKLPPATVRGLIDQSLIESDQAKSSGLIDHLVDKDALRELIGKQLGSEINLIHHYGQPDQDQIDMDDPWAFFSSLMRRPPAPTGPTVAIVYADGLIVDGTAGQSWLGSASIGSDDIRRAMRIVERNQNIKAVVLRINSPGGSALASEAMWQAVHRAAAKKPVIVSVGSMAASGGYYLASAADTIYADPSALVGSIGVVGGKFVIKDLLNKIGLDTDLVERGKNAGLFSSTRPFTPAQKQMLTQWMKHTYDQFTVRVMTTRKKIADIDKVARGRIFLATQAKDLGMVDQIGGLSAAINAAATRAGLAAGTYQVETIPEPQSFAQMLMGNREAISPIRASLPANFQLLQLLPAPLGRAVAREFVLVRLFQKQPVMLLAPCIPAP